MPFITRFKVFMIAFAPFLLATVVLFALSQVNIIPRNPVPFDGGKFMALYDTSHQDNQLEISWMKDEKHYRFHGAIQGDLKASEHGEALSEKDWTYYHPLWLPFANPVTTLKTENPRFDIYDALGILGDAGEKYTAIQEGSFILWDEILQSQASYSYGIFDLNNSRVASAVYDATSGLLFRLQVKKSDKPDLRLIKTSFPISRNRVALLIITPLASLALLILLFRRAGRFEGARRAYLKKQAWFVMLGMICVMTDTLMDLWYPFALGNLVPIAWHLGLVVVFMILGGRAAYPVFIELAMVFFFWIYHHGTAPTMAYIPGAIISFVILLDMQGRGDGE